MVPFSLETAVIRSVFFSSQILSLGKRFNAQNAIKWTTQGVAETFVGECQMSYMY